MNLSPRSLPGLVELALWSASEDDLAGLARLLHDTSCTAGCSGFESCREVRDGRYRRWVAEIATAASDRCTEQLARNTRSTSTTITTGVDGAGSVSRPDGGDPDPSLSRRPGVQHRFDVEVAA